MLSALTLGTYLAYQSQNGYKIHIFMDSNNISLNTLDKIHYIYTVCYAKL